MYNPNKNWTGKLLTEKLNPLEPQRFDSATKESTKEPLREEP